MGGYGGGSGGGIGSLLLYGFIAAVAFTALSGFFKNNEGDVYGALPILALSCSQSTAACLKVNGSS